LAPGSDWGSVFARRSIKHYVKIGKLLVHMEKISRTCSNFRASAKFAVPLAVFHQMSAGNQGGDDTKSYQCRNRAKSDVEAKPRARPAFDRR